MLRVHQPNCFHLQTNCIRFRRSWLQQSNRNKRYGKRLWWVCCPNKWNRTRRRSSKCFCTCCRTVPTTHWRVRLPKLRFNTILVETTSITRLATHSTCLTRCKPHSCFRNTPASRELLRTMLMALASGSPSAWASARALTMLPWAFGWRNPLNLFLYSKYLVRSLRKSWCYDKT